MNYTSSMTIMEQQRQDLPYNIKIKVRKLYKTCIRAVFRHWMTCSQGVISQKKDSKASLETINNYKVFKYMPS